MLDLLIRNANIVTMDAARPRAERIGVWRGQIVGIDEQLTDLAAKLEVDLAGATVLPGFVDAHNHLAWTGLAARSADVSQCRSIEALLDVVASAAQDVPAGSWLDVVGYDQRPYGRHVNYADLDRVSEGRKVYLLHTSGHACVVNSAVLELVGEAALRADLAGIDRDPDGRPTGVFTEDASALVSGLRNPYSLAELSEAVRVAGRICASQGVTFAAEAGLGGDLAARSPIEGLAYQRCLDDGNLAIRVQLMVTSEMLAAVASHPSDGIGRAFSLGLRTGLGNERLSVGALKIWLDGGMMARTAALTEPYTGSESTGELRPQLDQTAELVRQAHLAGWQVALHAIGDRAVDVALDMFSQAQLASPRASARHRIEHCGLVRPDQLERMARLGVTAVIQPTFLHAFGLDYASIMGEERANWMYRGRSFLDHGIRIAGSSDRPVADGAPLRAIAFMLDRRSKEGTVIGSDEAITIEEALAAYTLGSAYACGVDDRLGSIEVGKLADLVVLDGDPHTVPAADLPSLQVLTTVVAGEVVHGHWPH